MKRAYRILPCYAGDVSGVCSALYELEGMVVIHDPSGCNSTYNTHDETRWFAKDSMIYLSGLSELDAILGSDRKLLEEVCEAAQTLRPRFVALASSPIPYLSGMDLTAIARLVEQRTGIPSFYVPTNGLRDYNKGMENAFLQLERRFLTEPVNIRPGTVNILGVTPLDYGPTQAVQSLRSWLQERGWQVQSCWAMGSTLDELRQAGAAEVNLVVSAGGLALAQALQRRYGTPYVAGIPIGSDGAQVEAALRAAAATGENQMPCLVRGQEMDAARDEAGKQRKMPCLVCGQEMDAAREETGKQRKMSCLVRGDETHDMELVRNTDRICRGTRYSDDGHAEQMDQHVDSCLAGTGHQETASSVITLIGEPIIMGSLAAAIAGKYHVKTRVLCPLDVDKRLLAPEDQHIRGEEALEQALQGSRTIVADPMYQTICPQDAAFYPLPHQAFSGRNGWQTARDLITMDI